MTHNTDVKQLHLLLELVLTELDRKAIPIAYMQDIDRKGKAFIEQAAQAAVQQIDWESAAEKIAIEVADNCGTVPNLTHPHIYLGLKKLFATAPYKQHEK